MKLDSFKSAIILAACFVATTDAAACSLDQLIGNPSGFKGNTPICPLLATSTNRSSHWFTAINTPDHRDAFSAQVFQLTKAPQRGAGTEPGRYYQSAFNSTVKSSLRNINSNDVAACQHDECCKFLSDAIKGLSQASLKTLSTQCVMRITEDAKAGLAGRDLKILSLLPSDVLKNKGYAIVNQLSGTGGQIKAVPSTVLENILSQPRACKLLTPEDWGTLLSTSLKIMSKQCLHAGQKSFITAYAPGAKTSNLDKAVFELYNRNLHDDLIPTLTSDQVSNFAGKAEEGQFPGKNLDLNKLGSNAKGLTLRLLLGKIYSSSGYRMNFSRMAWSKVDENIFEKLSVDDAPAVAEAIKGDSSGKSIQELLSKTQVEHLARYNVICNALLPVTMNRKVEITKGCFVSMRPATQAAALVNGGPLPDNLLAGATSERIPQWTYDGTSGLNLLGLIRNRSNISKLISLMGTDVDYGHPCSLITDLEVLKGLPVLQKFMSARCRSKMAFKLEPEDYAGLNPRMIYLQSFADMKRIRKPEFWTKMSSTILGILLSIDGFCADIDKSTFTNINRDAYTALTSECVHQFSFLDELSVDVIQSIPAAVFVNDVASTLSATVVSMMSPLQLSVVGSEATKGASVGAHFSKAILDGFSIAHFEKIQSAHWTDVPDGSFGTFSTAERLAAVPGSAMVHWRRTQVGNISKEILAGMTPDQAENISMSTKVADSALHALTPDINFGPETKAIIERRRKEANITTGEEGSSSTWIIILVVSVAALLLVGAGAYLWNRNRQ